MSKVYSLFPAFEANPNENVRGSDRANKSETQNGEVTVVSGYLHCDVYISGSAFVKSSS